MTTRWQSVHQPALGCWIRQTEKLAQVYHFKAAPSSHDLKAADLIIDSPVFGEPSKLPDDLAAAPLTSGAPEFTVPVLLQHKPPQKSDIWAEIGIALDAAKAAKQKAPNPTKELPDIVHAQLIARGFKTTKKHIAEIGKIFKKQFPSRFQKRGARFR
jgi:hypothetical protein